MAKRDQQLVEVGHQHVFASGGRGLAAGGRSASSRGSTSTTTKLVRPSGRSDAHDLVTDDAEVRRSAARS